MIASSRSPTRAVLLATAAVFALATSAAAQLIVVPSPHGTITGDGIECGEGLPTCTLTPDEPGFVALKATPDPGYELLSWTGDCHGGTVALVQVDGAASCGAVFTSSPSDAPVDAFAFDGDSGFLFGYGRERRYAGSQVAITPTVAGDGSDLRFSIDTAENTTWFLWLQSPNGQRLGPGDYRDAVENGQVTGRPSLYAVGGGGCQAEHGRFVIYESEFADDGTLQTFAADFELHCGNLPATLYGAIRYHSTMASVEPFGGSYPMFRLIALPGTGGRVDIDYYPCSAPDLYCDHAGPALSTASLRATADDTHTFLRWSGDCSGTTPTLTVNVNRRSMVCSARFVDYAVYVSMDPVGGIARFGNPITWTAVASGTVPLEYQFWRLDPSGWVLARDWSSSPAYTWTPAYADIGHHPLQVWVRPQGSSVPYEIWKGSSCDVTTGAIPHVVNLTADHTDPLTATAAVTFTAQVNAGIVPPQYEFWRLDADGWHLAQPYGPSATYTWIPGLGDVGSHTLQVWVRNGDSPASYESWRGMTFRVVAPGPLRILSFTATNTPMAGQPTKWTAISSGAVVPVEYQFWRRDADGWHMARDYSLTNTYTWLPRITDVGPHVLQVWARPVGSGAAYEDWRGVSFSIPRPPPLTVRLRAGMTLTSSGDGQMSWEATATGGAWPYEYEWWRLDADGWHLGQAYGPSYVYQWDPGPGDVGTHIVQVWVRNAGSSAAYDAWASTGSFVVAIARH